jgi:hypothetical protein
MGSRRLQAVLDGDGLPREKSWALDIKPFVRSKSASHSETPFV